MEQDFWRNISRRSQLCPADPKYGGYIILGGTDAYGGVGIDVWLIKIDSNGIEQWNRTFGGKGSNEGTYVSQTKDGGYIIAGYTESFGSGNFDAWLIKIDANGNELWNKVIGGIRDDIAKSVQLTKDGGYIFAGSRTDLYGAGYMNAWLVKVDEGTTEAEKTLPAVYSMEELKISTDIPDKYQGKISDEDFDIVLRAVTPKIWTFDNGKYEKIKATLSLVGAELRDELWVDKFIFELEGYRDNKTETWQIEVEHPKKEKYASVTRVLGGGMIVQDKYIDIAKNIAMKKLDIEILNRTPNVLDTSPITDKPALVKLTFKDPNSPAHTIVAVNLNKNTIDSVEKKYWNLNFPLFFNITSNPSGADVYFSKNSPELCGPLPHLPGFYLIGKTPLTYKYEYNESFLPVSGLFSLFSFNITGYEDAFKCINIAGSESSEISVSSLSEGYIEPVSRASFIYNISAKLKPLDKINKEEKGDVSYGFLVNVSNLQVEDTTQTAEKATGFQFALAISIILAVYVSGQKRR